MDASICYEDPDEVLLPCYEGMSGQNEASDLIAWRETERYMTNAARLMFGEGWTGYLTLQLRAFKPELLMRDLKTVQDEMWGRIGQCLPRI